MATNFPSSLDTATQQPSPSASDAMDATGKEHATVHTNHSGALIALEAKMGTGTSNAASASDGHVLTANGSGGSAWAAAGGGGGGSPAGANTNVQVNSSGSFGGSSSLTFSDTAGLVVSPQNVASNLGSGVVYTALQIKGQSSLSNYVSANMMFTGPNDDWVGRFGFDGANTMRIKTYNGSCMIQANNGVTLNDSTKSTDSALQPQQDNNKDLGTSSLRWQDAYVTNGVTSGSDLTLKENIKDTPLGLDFINALRPVEYKWKDGTRKHQGFIAQEVKTVLDAKDKSSDQGIWALNTVKHPKEKVVTIDEESRLEIVTEIDSEPRQSLRYHEFIAPLVKAVQELTTQNEALTARIATLEG